MKIVVRILKITAIGIGGLFAFYLFLSLIIIPLAAPWVVGSQATKILKTPVKVRQVLFNPFLLRLNLKGFSISGADKQPMFGFDRAWADVSFLSFFKKTTRLEALVIEGMKVNAVLLEDGKVNLLELVPAAPVPAAVKPDKDAAKPAAPAPVLPMVIADLIELRNGTINFCDRSVNPNFNSSLNEVNLRIVNLTTRPQDTAKISFHAKMDNGGTIVTEVSVKPFSAPLALDTVFSLDNYALGVLSPYTGKYTGRKVKGGTLGLRMDYKIANNQILAAHDLKVRSFDFGDKVESKDALNLPFGLAVALLEDSQSRILISLPVNGDMSKPNFKYSHLIVQVIRNFFYKLVTKPFTFLASMVSPGESGEEFGYIKFAPGKADLSGPEKEKLKLIAKAMKDRPKLYLKVNESYDPETDWRSIKEDVFNNDYRLLRKDSKRADTWVYQELYQRRFGIKALWLLTKSYRSKQGVYDEEKINSEIKQRLINEGAPDKTALKELGQKRAQAVYDFLISDALGNDRVGIGDTQEAKALEGFVPLELGLTVYGDTAAPGVLK